MSDKASCPMESPMWQGIEADSPTTFKELILPTAMWVSLKEEYLQFSQQDIDTHIRDGKWLSCISYRAREGLEWGKRNKFFLAPKAVLHLLHYIGSPNKLFQILDCVLPVWKSEHNSLEMKWCKWNEQGSTNRRERTREQIQGWGEGKGYWQRLLDPVLLRLSILVQGAAGGWSSEHKYKFLKNRRKPSGLTPYGFADVIN